MRAPFFEVASQKGDFGVLTVVSGPKSTNRPKSLNRPGVAGGARFTLETAPAEEASREGDFYQVRRRTGEVAHIAAYGLPILR